MKIHVSSSAPDLSCWGSKKVLSIFDVIVRSCVGLGMLPPGFNDWEQPKHTRTDEWQNCRRLMVKLSGPDDAGLMETGG